MSNWDKTLNGWRIYRINLDSTFDNDTPPPVWKDNEFIEQAEKQGNVYTLEGFENAFNETDTNEENSYIRIINVAESTTNTKKDEG